MASTSRAGWTANGSPNRLRNDHVHLGDLDISFRRTIRVPDNQQLSQLPPDLGPFPLFQVRDYASKLPAEMAAKGGLFMPMYQREAMWVNFRSTKQYAIKVYVGAVNAVSGEPAIENAATQLRRRNKMAQGQSIQDYIVVPDQKWLDGIATSVGQVRQFVATPMGSGQSVEAQITGEDVVGGIQFEVTPRLRESTVVLIDPKAGFLNPPVDSVVVLEHLTNKRLMFQVQLALDSTVGDLKQSVLDKEFGWRETVDDLTKLRLRYDVDLDDTDRLWHRGIQYGSALSLIKSSEPKPNEGSEISVVVQPMLSDVSTFICDVNTSETVSKLKARIRIKMGIGSLRSWEDLSLMFGGKEMQNAETLHNYNIKQGDTILMRRQVCGGGGYKEATPDRSEMTLAPGGRIEQRIIKDPHHRPDPEQGSQQTRGGPSWQQESTASSGSGTSKSRVAPSVWDATKTVTFNVQVLNTTSFTRVTGLQPPETPVNAAEYARRGLPFFTLPDEPETDVSGDFEGIQSVAQLEGVPDPVVKPKTNIVLGSKGVMHVSYPEISSAPSSPPSSSSTAGVPPPATTPKHKPDILTQPGVYPSKTSSYRPPSFLRNLGRRLANKKAALPPNTAIPNPGDHDNTASTSPPAPVATGTISASGTATAHPRPIPQMNHTPVNTDLDADFFNPAGPRIPFRSVDDLERDMGRMRMVNFR